MHQKAIKSEKAGHNADFEGANQIFSSKEEMRTSLSRFCYADLYVVGRLWIEALKSVLVGADMNIFPAIHAAKPDPTPKKPPPMKYKDLPLYTSPHYEYKDFEDDKDKCPKYNVPILQEYLLPTIKGYRVDTQTSLCQVKCGVTGAWRQLKAEMADHDRNFKKYMRDPDKLLFRRAVVAFGSLSGYYLARNRGIPSRIFSTTLGGLLAGSICFPKETDEVFREILYRGGKVFIAVYNTCCRGELEMHERLTCQDQIPPPPPPRKPQCPMKK